MTFKIVHLLERRLSKSRYLFREHHSRNSGLHINSPDEFVSIKPLLRAPHNPIIRYVAGGVYCT
jgi:hypothetical protein